MKNINLYLFIAVISLGICGASVSHALDNGASPGAEKTMKAERKGGGRMPFIAGEDVEKVSGMSADDRKAYLQKKREEFKNMSPAEREAAKAKGKAWYESLSPEQKAKIKERRAQIKEKMRAEREERFKSLPPEQQEKIKEKRAAHQGTKSKSE